MSILNLQVHNLSSILNTRPVTNSYQPQNGNMSLGYSGNVVLETSSGRSPHFTLLTNVGVIGSYRKLAGGLVDVHGKELGVGKGEFAERSLDVAIVEPVSFISLWSCSGPGPVLLPTALLGFAGALLGFGTRFQSTRRRAGGGEVT